MSSFELDDVDRGILHLLQEDARDNSPATIAEEVGVAPNTVRNRIERLEEHGVIEGYHPQIDYERAGYQLRVIFVCTVPISERRTFADEAFDIDGVVRVVEVLSGRENLAVEAVAEDSDGVTAIASDLEDLGCEIADEWFVKNERVQPFDHFGIDVTDE
ncbi:transcriptional regulator, AsnC family [Halobiforma haloterrestris]|uniref:Transcriptional regulator, AsnC family n=1 Tax=Natronobacterium haloterrestre TaxID=148448 RepID=A0A1I1GQC2_NATHA|nr:Lrp/AsnC family transcriptional regulator [Halobiforma haloterrestris]SFC11463.1 transcriptional regulator, AsnC family [Halobiforma haloterrestris]